MSNHEFKILTVCLGNICRSPIAHGLVEHHAKHMGISVEVDSAGTIGIHSGNTPDPRSIDIMSRHGIDISNQRSRKIKLEDFKYYDLILVMDRSNYDDVVSLSRTEDEMRRVKMIISNKDVPDPYYGEVDGFQVVYDLINQEVPVWLDRLRKK